MKSLFERKKILVKKKKAECCLMLCEIVSSQIHFTEGRGLKTQSTGELCDTALYFKAISSVVRFLLYPLSASNLFKFHT